MHSIYQNQLESNGASNVYNGPGEWANLASSNITPTSLASVFKLDNNNLINGLTLPDFYAAYFVEPVMWTDAIYDSPARTSANAQQWPQPSHVDTWQTSMIQQYQNMLLGAP